MLLAIARTASWNDIRDSMGSAFAERGNMVLCPSLIFLPPVGTAVLKRGLEWRPLLKSKIIGDRTCLQCSMLFCILLYQLRMCLPPSRLSRLYLFRVSITPSFCVHGMFFRICLMVCVRLGIKFFAMFGTISCNCFGICYRHVGLLERSMC